MLNRRFLLSFLPFGLAAGIRKGRPGSALKLVRVSDASKKGTPDYIPGARIVFRGTDISSICFRCEEYSDGTVIAQCSLHDRSGSHVIVRNEATATVKVDEETRRAVMAMEEQYALKRAVLGEADVCRVTLSGPGFILVPKTA